MSSTTITTFDKFKINAIIYHHPCSDGTGAATCLYKFAKDNGITHDIDYIGDNYTNDPEHLANIIERVTGKYLVICDFSYNEATINKIKDVTENFIIIDHHKTAQAALVNLDPEHKIFDMSRSGAQLMWDFLFNSSESPALIKYIQDRDLFTNKLPYINEFVCWFYNLPLEVETYYEYLIDENKLTNGIMTKGVHYKEITDIYINNSTWSAPVFCTIGNKAYFVAYCNSNLFKSDIGNRLLSKYKMVDFSVVYSINSTGSLTSYSLRSASEFTDISAIAKLIGGGGHRNASGATSNGCQALLPCCNDNCADMYNLLEDAWFSIGDLNIIYIKYHDNYEKLQEYILGGRETEGTHYLQQASYIYKVLNNIDVDKSMDHLPIFDACVVHKKVVDDVTGTIESHFIVKTNTNNDVVTNSKLGKLMNTDNVIIIKDDVNIISC